MRQRGWETDCILHSPDLSFLYSHSERPTVKIEQVVCKLLNLVFNFSSNNGKYLAFLIIF